MAVIADVEAPVSGAPRQVSGMMSRLTLAHVRRRAGDDGVRRVLETAGETANAAALEDGGGWCSLEQVQTLVEAAGVVLDDPEVGLHIGSEVLQHGIVTPLAVVTRKLGSPNAVFRNVARASRRFNAVIETELLSIGPNFAVVAYRHPEGSDLRLSYCQLIAGVVSQIPVLFGLPPAAVAHGECQAQGGARCVYRFSWAKGRSRLPWRAWRRRLEQAEAQAADVAEQMEALHSTVADLVSAGDVAEVLRRIGDRAGTAVRAHRYLLAVRCGPAGEVRMHACGFGADEARRMASEVLDADPGADDDRLVVEVASARRHHGRLAAFAAPGAGFLDGERRLFSSYARCAAAALDAATAMEEARVLGEEAHRRGETAAVLLELARRLANATSAGDVARRLASAVPTVVGADRGAVVLWDPASETARVAGAHGWSEDLDHLLRSLVLRPSDTPVIGRMLAQPEPLFFDRGTDDDFIAALFATFGGAALTIVPIEAQGEVLGVVLADWLEAGSVPPFDAVLTERLAGLAGQGASALRSAYLLEQVTHQARHDALTGLPNRVLFRDRADQALARARRAGDRHVGLLFLDLDGFKEVNDTLGHAVGDELLRHVASRLTSLVRDSDTVTRLGGDEFTVLLPDVASADDLGSLAEKVLAAVAEPVVVGGSCLRVTASVGVAVSGGDDHFDALVRRADEAMYRAKVEGRATWRPSVAA